MITGDIDYERRGVKIPLAYRAFLKVWGNGRDGLTYEGCEIRKRSL